MRDSASTPRGAIYFPLILLLLIAAAAGSAQVRRAPLLPLLNASERAALAGSTALKPALRVALQRWQAHMRAVMTEPAPRRPRERDLQALFFEQVFVAGLGYRQSANAAGPPTLRAEMRTDVDWTRPDGVLGRHVRDGRTDDIRAVIELKRPGAPLDQRQNRPQDRRTPIDQAFSYAHKFDAVDWVIVSNFTELRIYRAGSSKYGERFDLLTLADKPAALKLFQALLQPAAILRPAPEPARPAAQPVRLQD